MPQHDREDADDDEREQWATGRLLSTAARLVEHAWDAHLSSWDLNHASFAVLWSLAAGPRSQRELAAGHQVEEQTMSRILERMEAAGYVTRERSAEDRRRRVVRVTSTGMAAARQAASGNSAEDLFLSALSEGEIEQLRARLLTLVRSMGSRRWQ